MEITKKHLVVAGILLTIVLIALVYLSAYFVSPKEPVAEVLGEPTTEASSTEQVKPLVVKTGPFKINKEDSISDWNFVGIYAGNDSQIQKVQGDITLLTSLIGKGEYDDYDLYNGIANDYAMLGKGALAYDNFNRSISIHPAKGLAYTNLAHLLDQLGAVHTAADAYTKAVTVEPYALEYHVARLTYLTQKFTADEALVSTAFADAAKQFGETAQTLSIKAEWLTSLGRYADAIKVWETVKMLKVGADNSAIDAAILRLKAKQ